MTAYSRTYNVSQVATAETILADHLNAEFATIFTALGTSGITATQLAAGSVTNTKLGADAVDGTKIADNAIDSEHYTDLSIDTAHIANLAVTAGKIATATITRAKLADAAHWTYDATEVFNDSLTAANTFQDLDVSAVVGANVALCFFQVRINGTYHFAMKPKGIGGAFTVHDGDHSGVGHVKNSSSNDYAYVICQTDSSGIVQIGYANDSTTVVIDLMGYIA